MTASDVALVDTTDHALVVLVDRDGQTTVRSAWDDRATTAGVLRDIADRYEKGEQG